MTAHVVEMSEAKNRLPDLMRLAEDGVDVVVARSGQPVTKLIAWPTGRSVRIRGEGSGQVTVRGDIVGSDPASSPTSAVKPPERGQLLRCT